MKRQRWTIGSIVKIKVDDFYCFAQILKTKDLAFFDFRSNTDKINLEQLEEVPVLFIISVYYDIITKGIWEKIGKIPIRKELEVLPMEYIHHTWGGGPEWELYNPNTGEITPSTKEEAEGLECCAVWDSHHVEDRLRCHYNGTHCIWLDD